MKKQSKKRFSLLLKIGSIMWASLALGVAWADGPIQTIDLNLNEVLQAGKTISIADLLKLGPLDRGKTIEKIELSTIGGKKAVIIIDGKRSDLQNFTQKPTEISVEILNGKANFKFPQFKNELGLEIQNDIELWVSQTVTLKKVSAVLRDAQL